MNDIDVMVIELSSVVVLSSEILVLGFDYGIFTIM